MHDRLLTKTLHEVAWGSSVARILSAALTAVEPAAAVQRFVQRDGDLLRVGDQTYHLEQYDRVFVVGTGKAGTPMARAIASILGERLTQGVIVIKEGYGEKSQPEAARNLLLIEASHPVPDERCIAGAQRVAGVLADTTERDLVIVLISGGGSALLTLPVPGVTLSDLQDLTKQLLSSGATINEINALRKHLDQVKGGGLARIANPATVVTLILSDVVGNPLDVIASGPTVPDSSTFADAWGVLEQRGVAAKIPASIRSYLEQGRAGLVPETLKAGDPIFTHVANVLVGSNLQAAEAALATARGEDYNTLLLTTFLQGEAREAGRVLAAIGRELATSGHPLARPACVVAGGETTVTITGGGKGGRNQEMALAAVFDLAGLPDVALVTLATDGGDGPTDAAGAVVTGTTLARALGLGLHPAEYLARNDAYHFFEALGDLLKPGPTNTNVNDLAFVFSFG